MNQRIRVGERGTYVEKIAHRNLSNPFLRLWAKYGVEEVQRIPEYAGFRLGDKVLVKTKNGLKYAEINFIVRVITCNKLYDKVVFILGDMRGSVFTQGRIFFFGTENFLPVESFSLSKNSILLSGKIDSHSVFDGFTVYDVDVYAILKQNISREDKIGELHYQVRIPDSIAGIDTSKIPREKHISGMSQLDDHEIFEFRGRGINFIFANHIRCEDGEI